MQRSTWKFWWSFLRFPNLLIVALTQYLLRLCVLLPLTPTPVFNELDFFMMVLGTMVVAAGGYIINDLYDYPIDVINKPEKTFINRIISSKNAYIFYFCTSFFVVLIGVYFYIRTGWLASWTYPIVGISMLWLYSYKLKKSILLGNITVALFCAFVPFMVYVPEATTQFPEYELISNFRVENADPLKAVFYVYAGFAFLSTFYREVVKDIEDQEGDRTYAGRTLPIVMGQKVAQYVALILGFLLFLLVIYILYWDFSFGSKIRWLYALVGITLPLVYAQFLLIQAKKKEDFHKISQIIKGIMVTGLLYLVVFYWTS